MSKIEIKVTLHKIERMMDQYIAGFPAQLKEAMKIGRDAEVAAASKKIQNVVVAGLGGSGIGGLMVSELVCREIKVPIQVSNAYSVPNYVNENSLCIMCSYSGNTEETLQAYTDAKSKGAQIVCITSGGKLVEMAESDGYDVLRIPGGNPPRTALGYSFVQQLFILKSKGLISDGFESRLEDAVTILEKKSNEIRSTAKELAVSIKGHIPIIYCDQSIASVAIRFRQQINENSKMLCWHHVIPEMNHNELVGWTSEREDWVVVIFRNKEDFDRNQQRIEINKEIISKYCKNIIEIWSEGETLESRYMHLVHLGDWISYELAELRGVDSVEVNVIDGLKSALAAMR